MGQQQLFILIVISIIVALATIVALNTLEVTNREANESAIRQDIMMILNDVQKYYYTPAALGGGDKSFDGINESHIHSINLNNENGRYEIAGNGDILTVEGTSNFEGIGFVATLTISKSSNVEIVWSDSID